MIKFRTKYDDQTVVDLNKYNSRQTSKQDTKLNTKETIGMERGWDRLTKIWLKLPPTPQESSMN